MPGGFGAFIESLREILRIVGRRGTTRARLRTRVEARFGKDENWLRGILSFLVNTGLLKQDGEGCTHPGPARPPSG